MEVLTIELNWRLDAGLPGPIDLVQEVEDIASLKLPGARVDHVYWVHVNDQCHHVTEAFHEKNPTAPAEYNNMVLHYQWNLKDDDYCLVYSE